jgi:hypothetical protein
MKSPMKHLTQIQIEFSKTALDLLRLDRDSVIKFNGIPFILSDNTPVLGRKENLDLATRENYAPFGMKHMQPETEIEEDSDGQYKQLTNETAPADARFFMTVDKPIPQILMMSKQLRGLFPVDVRNKQLFFRPTTRVRMTFDTIEARCRQGLEKELTLDELVNYAKKDLQ